MSFIGEKMKSLNVLNTLPLGSIRAGGWIRQQLQKEAAGMSGHLDELEPSMIGEPYVSRKQEEKLSKIFQGAVIQGSITPGWCCEISGTYWYGLIQLAYVLNDKNLIKKACVWVDKVLANQENDGYIGSYKKTDNRMEDYNAWGTNWGLRALLAFFEATGRIDVIEACHRGLKWFVKNWEDNHTDYVSATIIESMLRVYKYTGDNKLLEWSESYLQWLQENSRWPIKLKDLHSGYLPYNSMHVVAYGEHVKIPAMLYCFTGRKNFLEASVKGINKIVEKSFQRTGGPSSNVEYISPIGAAYETEYCNFSTYSDTFAWMAMITGDASYGDLIEKIVFNGSEGAKKKDGRAIAYNSAPNQIFATLTSSIYGDIVSVQVYAPNYHVCCCPVQSVRVLPEYVRKMCLVDDRGCLYFNCYGPCNIETRLLNGTILEIEENTKYPFNSEIVFKFKLSHKERIIIYFRIPSWCKNASIYINGRKTEKPADPGSFYAVTRVWSDGDVVTLDLPMEVTVVEVDDSDGPNNKPYAVEMGPLLFSLKIDEKWRPVEGTPITKLPEGWSWFEAVPKESYESLFYPSHYAVSENLPEIIKDGHAEVVYCDSPGDLPWENEPVKIRIPAKRVKHLYPRYPMNAFDVYKDIREITSEDEMIELVPYGCTNLRISYLPVIRKCERDHK